MSDTPRVDKLMLSLSTIGGTKTEVRAARTAWGQTIDLAREIERELAEIWAENQRLKRELTAALKDAERYRWLRENVNWSSNLKERMYYLKTVKNYTSLDDAIDSEITKEKS